MLWRSATRYAAGNAVLSRFAPPCLDGRRRGTLGETTLATLRPDRFARSPTAQKHHARAGGLFAPHDVPSARSFALQPSDQPLSDMSRHRPSSMNDISKPVTPRGHPGPACDGSARPHGHTRIGVRSAGLHPTSTASRWRRPARPNRATKFPLAGGREDRASTVREQTARPLPGRRHRRMRVAKQKPASRGNQAQASPARVRGPRYAAREIPASNAGRMARNRCAPRHAARARRCAR